MILNYIYITHKIFNQSIMKRENLKMKEKKWMNEKFDKIINLMNNNINENYIILIKEIIIKIITF